MNYFVHWWKRNEFSCQKGLLIFEAMGDMKGRKKFEKYLKIMSTMAKLEVEKHKLVFLF